MQIILVHNNHTCRSQTNSAIKELCVFQSIHKRAKKNLAYNRKSSRVVVKTCDVAFQKFGKKKTECINYMSDETKTLENLVFGAGMGKDGFSAPRGVKAPDGSVECALVTVDSKMSKDEKMIFFFRNKGPYNVVVLTDKRFIKIEDGKIVSTIDIDQMVGVEHEKNGIFRWDKVVVKTTKGTDLFLLRIVSLVVLKVVSFRSSLRNQFYQTFLFCCLHCTGTETFGIYEADVADFFMKTLIRMSPKRA